MHDFKLSEIRTYAHGMERALVESLVIKENMPPRVVILEESQKDLCAFCVNAWPALGTYGR